MSITIMSSMDGSISYNTLEAEWGSVLSHLNDDGSRRLLDLDDLSSDGCDIPGDQDPRLRQLSGRRHFMCQTNNEHKAIQLNKTAEYRLDSYKTQIQRQKVISERQHQQKEQLFRAKSARLFQNILTEDDKFGKRRLRPRSLSPGRAFGQKLLNQRPQSSPESSRKQMLDLKDGCFLCRQIQEVIMTYERGDRKSGEFTGAGGYSTCLFSDIQAKAFVELLENGHFEKVPHLNSTLKETGNSHLRGHQQSRTATISKYRVKYDGGVKYPVEIRINNFCQRLDKFNRNNGVPDLVKRDVENHRFKQAMLLKHIPLEETESVRKSMHTERIFLTMLRK